MRWHLEQIQLNDKQQENDIDEEKQSPKKKPKYDKSQRSNSWDWWG